MASKQLKIFTREEVAKHNKQDDLWIIIDAKVYDLTRFVGMHPGGIAALTDEEVAGQDATDQFFALHRFEILLKPQYQRLIIGNIEGEEAALHPPNIGDISKVPYAEPTWLTEGYYSPYYTENHRELQRAVRRFTDEYLVPDALAREEDGKRPDQKVLDKMAELELHAMRLGPGKHLQGRTLMGGIVKPEEFNYFHELVVMQEMVRCGARGYGDGLLGGKPRAERSRGPGGSDVMGLQTTAVKSEDGKEWIINGSKKWITNGTFADYFTVGCKTEDGFTVILVERGPAFITFDNARAPVGNTLGEEGGGIFVMLSNFNHERWVMCCASARAQRGIVEECLKWTSQRKAFGKPLNSLATVRAKLAAMIQRAESVQNWLESITYQMCNMSYKQQASKLAGQIALLKSYSTSCAQETARDAVQLFGGRGITKTGMGRLIEHYHRTIPFDALLGGAEDVLSDLGTSYMM
ncbi:acyl- - peroxisomal [Lentinula edodes]|uniref:Acyl--peroxisomal n=1 Tax=Lentinula edodes TaxID=5353 RepID=A0A1Q3EDF7_LENED|nr:acyl- - peroxisomal [Lentinula edodes]